MKRDVLVNMIRGTNGKFFTVTFRKKDGSIRKMNGRIGVKKHLRGGESTTAHIPQYVNMFDVQAKGYRTVNVDTLISAKISGITLTVDE